VKALREVWHSIHRQEPETSIICIVAFAMCMSLGFLGCRVSDLSLHIKEGSISGQVSPAPEGASDTNTTLSSPIL
jgi:hypothetical protein